MRIPYVFFGCRDKRGPCFMQFVQVRPFDSCIDATVYVCVCVYSIILRWSENAEKKRRLFSAFSH